MPIEAAMFSPAATVFTHFDLETKVMFGVLCVALLMALQLALNLQAGRRSEDDGTPDEQKTTLEKLARQFLKLFL